MTTLMFGIPNCDTVKKARGWLDARGTAYTFHDYKKAGVDDASLRRWVAALGWETVLNRGGHDLPQAARCRPHRSRRREGDRVDAGAAFDDQTADPRR